MVSSEKVVVIVLTDNTFKGMVHMITMFTSIDQSVSDHLKVSWEAKKNEIHQFALIYHNIFIKKQKGSLA